MWQAICNFFAGLFGKKSTRQLAETAAAALIAANNKEKAAQAAGFLKAALVMAKAGKLTDDLFASALAKVSSLYQGNNAIRLALMAFINTPEIKLGEVNPKVVEILERLLAGVGAAK